MRFRVGFMMFVQAKVVDHDDSDDGFDRVAAADTKAKTVLTRAHHHHGKNIYIYIYIYTHTYIHT